MDGNAINEGVFGGAPVGTDLGVPLHSLERIDYPGLRRHRSWAGDLAQLAEMMGGRIEVESEIGRSSTFRFTLSSASPRCRHTPPVSVELEGLRVLVVDDSATNRRILRQMLGTWRMAAHTADSGRTALMLLENAAREGEQFPLVILDAHMPEMDGFAVAKRIRGDATISSATLMMLTSAGHQDDLAKCRELGVSSYVTKPLRQSELLDAVMMALGRSINLPDEEPAAWTVPDQGRRLRILLAEDNPVNQRLAAGILTKRGHAVRVALDGREAVEAAEGERFDLVLMAVHMPEMGGFEATAMIRQRERIHGGHLPIVALANFGADEAVQGASRLEQMGAKGDLAEADDACETLLEGHDALRTGLERLLLAS